MGFNNMEYEEFKRLLKRLAKMNKKEFQRLKSKTQIICSICGGKTFYNRLYASGERRMQELWFNWEGEGKICANCNRKRRYRKQPISLIRRGKLRLESTVAKGYIGEKVVAEVLNVPEEHQLNSLSLYGLNSKYDLYHDEFGNINVKTRQYDVYTVNAWNFMLKGENGEIPDTYILMGFSSDGKDIKRVWIIPSNEKIIENKKGIFLSDIETSKPYKKVKIFEQDARIYNEAYHSMDFGDGSFLKI